MPREKLRRIAVSLLDASRPAYSLRDQVLELKSIFENAGAAIVDRTQDIGAGETRTTNGVAISPTMASMCVDDFARTVQFIRGLHQAIWDLREIIRDRPIRVLYAGCGPWATLAVPLMSVFNGDEVRFTLLDIHEESIRSAERIVGALGVEDRVKSFEIADAADFEIDPEARPDVIVIEMLRAALESEPQVAVALNLFAQAPDASMIPAEVTINLALVNAAREFSFGDEKVDRDRIQLGTVFTLDRRVVESGRLEPTRIDLPDFDTSRYRPMLLTTIRIHGQHFLRDYDSGITCPKEFRIDECIAAGDAIEFGYQLGSDPRLTVKRRDS